MLCSFPVLSTRVGQELQKSAESTPILICSASYSGGGMYSDPASRMPRKHANGWMTILALGLLVVGLLACLYILVGFPAEAQAVSDTSSSPSSAPVDTPTVPV